MCEYLFVLRSRGIYTTLDLSSSEAQTHLGPSSRKVALESYVPELYVLVKVFESKCYILSQSVMS